MTDAPSLPHSQKAVGARLKIIRLYLDLPQEKMAEKYGLSSQQGWANYESGKRPLPYEVAVVIADDLGIPLDWIYRGIAYFLPTKYKDAFATLEDNVGPPKARASRKKTA